MRLKNGIFSVALLTLIALPVRSVVIRDDVSDRAYRELAAKPEFLSGNVVLSDSRGPWSGVAIGKQYVMTAGHPIEGYDPQEKGEGALPAHRVKVSVLGREYEADYYYLCPACVRTAKVPAEKREKFPLGDVAILHLATPTDVEVKPSSIWLGSVRYQEVFTCVGIGKSGTGLQRDEPLPAGTVRGFTNRIDYLDVKRDGIVFRADFDDGSEAANILDRTVYGDDAAPAQGSSSVPTSREGTTAAGDSGGAAWVQRSQVWTIAGIASFRYY